MIIFVAGVHAVGKTYLGAPAAKKMGLRYATASQLIREERGLQSWGGDKRVVGIDENQAALISAINRLRSSGEKLMLDGHFVLRGANGEFSEINLHIFRDLQIGAVLLLQASTDVVIERLRARGDSSWTESELQIFSELEATHANRIADQLGVAFTSLCSPSQEEFENAVCTILGAV